MKSECEESNLVLRTRQWIILRLNLRCSWAFGQRTKDAGSKLTRHLWLQMTRHLWALEAPRVAEITENKSEQKDLMRGTAVKTDVGEWQLKAQGKDERYTMNPPGHKDFSAFRWHQQAEMRLSLHTGTAGGGSHWTTKGPHGGCLTSVNFSSKCLGPTAYWCLPDKKRNQIHCRHLPPNKRHPWGFSEAEEFLHS